jgi:phage gpG-like protein
VTVIANDADLRELERKLAELERGPGIRDLARNIGEEAVELVREGFEQERDPYGAAWAPLSYRDGQILRDRGVMLNSLHVAGVTESQVTIAMGVWYAIVHQTGKTIVPRHAAMLRFMVRGKPVFAHQVTIPARPFFPRDGDVPSSWGASLDETTDEWFRQFFGR